MMQFAFGGLYMDPERFWSFTWREWCAAIGGWSRYGPPGWLGGGSGGEGGGEGASGPGGASRARQTASSWEEVRRFMAAVPQGVERRGDVRAALKAGRNRRRRGRG